ncbi:Metallo-dependent phosphatase-like protein [Naematelia encephala]|uniref:Metallo-dependent phosphatase-like protein n=1 Tax=Naematelia encephala TaxID=71784 RepID=A0A1Y2AGM3_9TREE|nr:Metallo-dependent phosphatase-like protein [Naematelia encephala]
MPALTPDYYRKPPRYLYLKSFLPVILLLLVFSFALSTFSLLSHFRSPADKQQIGWQSWDVVEIKGQKSGSGEDVEVGGGSVGNQTSGQEDFVPSIPLDNWDPLSLHTTGLTEIAIKSCYFPPSLLPSYCAPQTTGELDKTKGKWVIVEKDLNLRSGLWYLNIYYRRTRRLDVPLISDIKIVDEPVPDTLKSDLEGWVKAEGDLHSGTWPTQPEKRLWYKLQEQDWDWKRSDKRQDEISYDYGNLITEVDVIYGDDDPFFGFERVQGGKVTEVKAGKWESVDLAIRRGNPVAPRGVVPKFSANGKLKIMQIADLHYSVGTGECRDSDKEPCVGDPDTATWLGEALDAEDPDLVVFSGDQLNGQGTSYDARSVLAKFAKPVIDREIPWCAIFGNHDSEIANDRDYQMRTLQNMPYSLAMAGPKAVDGVGNYYIKLHSHDASRTHLFTLYFLDSGSYQKKKFSWSKAEYDYIKESQIEWFRNASSGIKPIQRPFTPDGAEDLGHIWSRKSRPSRIARQTTKLAKPNAMMWFHIPLPEAYNPADVAGFDGDELDVGDQFDWAGSSKHNSGFFYNGIKQSFETVQDEDEATEWGGTTKVAEVKVLSHGHCHNTDRCRRTDGIWMCFDGGSSFSGYGQLGFDRRVRVYQISQYGEKIETYKRLTNGDIIDEQVLVGPGAPAGWGEDQLY